MKKMMMRSALMPVALVAAFGGGIVASSAGADQPYMHSALEQLGTARATLAAGTPDKGGHRVRAMAYIDRAMTEVRAGINYDRRNY